MAELIQVNGRTYIDYMARDYDSLLQSMRALIPEKLPEWNDFQSEADFGNVLLELFAHMGDILSYYQDRIANESFLGTAQSRRSVIQHLGLIGYKLATAAPAAASLTLTVKANVNDTITIKQGDAFATKSQKDKPSVRFEYVSPTPLIIDCATLPVNKDGKKQFEGILLEEGKLYQGEIVGISNGAANQLFPLPHAGLILRSFGQAGQQNRDIIVTSQLGNVIEEWALQESLAFSSNGQRDFAIDIDEQDRATLRFGDGALGAIPPKGATLKATYRVGGGSHGNVAAGRIVTIVKAPQLTLLAATISNKDAATGGAERESIEHAVAHAPGVFRSLRRAVTRQDYEALARNFRGVGKVRAEASGWNTVKLFVAPAGGGSVSNQLRDQLLAYFEDKRPLSTVIEIENVKYPAIRVTAKVSINRYYDGEEMKERIREKAGGLLAFDQVDFGRPLYLSKFYEAIEAIEGVNFVTITEFRRQPEAEAPEPQPPVMIAQEGTITFGPNEIPKASTNPLYLGAINVEII